MGKIQNTRNITKAGMTNAYIFLGKIGELKTCLLPLFRISKAVAPFLINKPNLHQPVPSGRQN